MTQVRIPDFLRSLTADETVVPADGTTLAAVIDDLESRYPGVRDRLVDESGLRRFVNVYVNDVDVRFREGLRTPVGPSDRLTILPAVAGGAGAAP